MSKGFLTIAIVGLLAVAGCGGDDNGGSAAGGGTDTGTTTEQTTTEDTTTAAGGSGGATKLQLTAVPDGLKYDKESLSAKAGEVTIEMKNDSSLSHDVAVKGNGVDEQGEAVGQGEQSTVTANLKPGKYTFYCSVDGHEAAGMKGDLTVQ